MSRFGGIKVKGVREFMAALDRQEVTLTQALDGAVQRALLLVRRRAQEILVEEQSHKWPDKDGEFHPISEGDLYRAFRREVIRTGASTVLGALYNTDPAAPYLEFGTTDHPVDPVSADALRFWVNAETMGESALHFSRHEDVSGVREIAFMRRALEETRAEVRLLFADLLRRGGFPASEVAGAFADLTVDLPGVED